MVKVAHIYASNAKSNSGDFMIGIAYKKYFQEVILNGKKCSFVNLDCRNKNTFNDKNIQKINNFDYILIGGGGLILPDSAPNNISCWQWNISKNCINKITKPLYVLSIGYNLFFNQNMNMTSRENNSENRNRMNIFNDNIITLIKKAKIFSMRHNKDVDSVLKIIGDEYKNHISYEKCATVWYVNKYWKPKIIKLHQKFIAIEIKDDREWRRYYKIGKKKYYNELKKVILYLIKNNRKVLYLSHDGSKNFYRYLRQNKIVIPLLDNSCANEGKILQNYSKIHTILCSAGHSQMISNGCGIKTISLVSHPKIRNYCDDIGDNNFVEINKLTNDGEVYNKIVELL